MRSALTILLMAVTLTACSPGAQKVKFHEENPAHLSAWGVVKADKGALVLGRDVIPYDLNTPLFTDYAHKLRTLWIPSGAAAHYREEKALDFPVGTIISKTFYYPKNENGQVLRTADYSHDFAGEGLDLKTVRLVETRILVHRTDGWVALPYIWNEAQTDAVLSRVGGAKPLSLISEGRTQDFTYIVPNANQCAGCHAPNATTRKISPIGPKARHLNKTYSYASGPQNQLQHLASLGKLTGFPSADQTPKNADWRDDTQSLDSRARAWLDINCGHCHNPHGAADTSALYLDRPAHTYPAGNTGACKPPVAAGQGTGGHTYDIVPGKADQSILTYRLSSTNPGVMMPELGRSLVDEEALALITAWINAMPGACS